MQTLKTITPRNAAANTLPVFMFIKYLFKPELSTEYIRPSTIDGSRVVGGLAFGIALPSTSLFVTLPDMSQSMKDILDCFREAAANQTKSIKLQIGSIGFCIMILLVGGCATGQLVPAKKQKTVNYSGPVTDTNAFEDRLNQMVVTFSLDRIALLLSLTDIHNPEEFELAIKGHLIAALDVNETNELVFPSIATAVRTNQYYISATAWRHANISANKYVAKVSSKSPLRHSEAELTRLTNSIPASFVHDFKTIVLDEDMANIQSYLLLMQRTGKDSYLDGREIA